MPGDTLKQLKDKYLAYCRCTKELGEMKKIKEKQKICSRGHKYMGSNPCPICYPGYKKKLASKNKNGIR